MIPSLQDGGIEAQLPRLYKALGNEKYEFYVYCLANIEYHYPIKRFEDIGCTVRTFRFVNVNRKFYHIFTNCLQVLKLAFNLRKNNFDVVNYHDFFSATMSRFAIIIARLMLYKPQRSILTLHNMQFWLGGIHRIINKVLSRVTDKVVCVSESVYNFSKENDKLREDKYVLVINGIDINEFKPDKEAYYKFRKELGYSDNDFLIGQVGTFSVRKGQKYLVEAFVRFHKRYPDAKLVIVGGYREHEPEIYNEVVALIKENGLENSVNIVKTRNDIYNIYNMLDLYVMPSTVEGFGLALAEAMACGKVAVGSDIPPFREIITEGEDGFIFKSKDVDSLVKVLSGIRENFKNLAYIEENARHKIVEKFSNINMVRQYNILYSHFN
jgi:glycosyltransferase involved in cell wall biosynthesis